MYRVKIFDFEHESDLEEEINKFLQKDIILKEIKYQTSHFFDGREQIYSFSAMIIFEKK